MNLSTADEAAACEFRQNLDLLRGIDFFASLPIGPLKVLAYLCSRERYAPAETLLAAGDDDGQALYIIKGEAELVRICGDSACNVVRRYGQGAFIGGLALLAPMPRLFALRAASELHCLMVTRAQFSRVMEQYPELTPRILRNVVARVRDWERSLLREGELQGEVCQQTLGVSLL
jgi:CRP-like cAMP-binding protein